MMNPAKAILSKIKRIRGGSFSILGFGGGVQWDEDPSQKRIEKVVEEHIRLCDNSGPRIHPPILIRAGAATLQDNSELEEVCRQIEMRGYKHQFLAWRQHGVQRCEMLEFIQWQINTPRACKTLIDVNEQVEVAKMFRAFKENR